MTARPTSTICSERLVLPWPVAVDELALIGHSMGALVARAAHLRATERGATWPAHCGHLVFLGAPHLGAPLERGAALLGRALDSLPETRPFATILDVRSAGIRDLGRGHQARGCWVRDDAVRPIAEHFIVATLARNPRGRAGAVIGDLLVTPRSAAGSHCAQCEVRLVDSVTTIGGLSHMDLLNHPAVYAELRDSLTCTTTPRARTR